MLPSEFCDLNLADLPQSHGQPILYVCDAVSSLKRPVLILPRTVERIGQWLKEHRQGAQPYDPLLTNTKGQRMRYSALRVKLTRIGHLAGIGKVRPYILRNTYAMRLYAAERDAVAVAGQLGLARHDDAEAFINTNSDVILRQLEKMDEVEY
jgi:site-specific recombinase XerC